MILEPLPRSLPPAAPAATSTPPLSAVIQALGVGLAIVLCQVLLGCLLAREANFRKAYVKLFNWDSGWYASIVEKGYVSPPVLRPDDPGNVAFFPGYPLASSLTHRVSGLTRETSLLLTAQLAAWGFWTYLLLFFHRWRVSGTLSALGVLLIASHPAAFFLVAGYTESLFLVSLLGFLYWSARGSALGLGLAALHGFVMTSTRFVGLPVAAYPLFLALLHVGPPVAVAGRRFWARVLPALGVTVFASLGTVLFFLYCHYRFGHWDLYMRTSLVGWGTSSNYLAFFSWRTYCPQPPFLRDGFLNPIWFNQFLVPFTVLLFASLVLLEYRYWRIRPEGGWRTRAALYACAALMFYVSVCGNSTVSMHSMPRFLLCVEVVLVLAVIHWLSQTAAVERGGGWLRPLLGAWVVLGYLFQFWFTYRFTHGQWVA